MRGSRSGSERYEREGAVSGMRASYLKVILIQIAVFAALYWLQTAFI